MLWRKLSQRWRTREQEIPPGGDADADDVSAAAAAESSSEQEAEGSVDGGAELKHGDEYRRVWRQSATLLATKTHHSSRRSRRHRAVRCSVWAPSDPKSHVDPDEAPRGYASKRNAVDPPVVRRRAGSGIEVAAVGEVAGERAAVPTCDIGNLATAAPPAPPATDFCFDELD